ncbi:hypothetical protein TRM7557_03527 [Tritonibacter multivorans]|uniref:DUF7742 domain-containing protein n=1 Tax=Tritonibacter multivorans TaxID=928856 RepID=A0A0P1GIG2_9RHOB|nr:hypothetical protein [Tritonibacter multivorans]MDA7420418.1 hypothetical protein [Tritonibacter multivorans]CUH81645.1 hypothetical protein TRM7557_03527 [Tritonibacter multivorans]SFC40111.1 hypothetical protein SAMN04488049_102364 [Tritonibacter multivorans]
MRRPVLPNDIITCARALLACRAEKRGARARTIAQGARRAGRYAQVTGRLHPRWGDGSLDAAARRFALAPEPFWDDPEYIACLQTALAVVQQQLPKRIIEKAPEA